MLSIAAQECPTTIALDATHQGVDSGQRGAKDAGGDAVVQKVKGAGECVSSVFDREKWQRFHIRLRSHLVSFVEKRNGKKNFSARNFLSPKFIIIQYHLQFPFLE